jgi:hypothetical protein
VCGGRGARLHKFVQGAVALHAVHQLGEHGHAANGGAQYEHLHSIREHKARQLVARVDCERARAQEGDAADRRGHRLGVFAHRPARQPHAKAVVVYEQSCDGAERVSDERAEQGRSRPTGSDPGCPRLL